MSALPISYVLATLGDAGVTVSFKPKALWAAPARAIALKVRDLIGRHRAELIHHLANDAANENTMMVVPQLPIVDQSASGLASRSYLAHHWTCPACCAGGQGRGTRCNVGAMFWSHY